MKGYKRNKGLGTNIIWEPIVIDEYMQRHHINKNDIVVIPRRIHRSVYHNVFTNEGMKEINNLAYKYIISHSVVFPIVIVK